MSKVASTNVNVPTATDADKDITLTVAKLHFNGNDYLGIEINYHHPMRLFTAIEYETEITVMSKAYVLKHLRYNNDRLYLPTFLKWSEVESQMWNTPVVQCSARIVNYKFIENSGPCYSNRSYHGQDDLRNVNTVDLTINVGKYQILVNKDYVSSISGFFKQVLSSTSTGGQYNLNITTPHPEAFITMFDICHHKFRCDIGFKDTLLELAKIYQFPLVEKFHKRVFGTTDLLDPDLLVPVFDLDREFSLEKVMNSDISCLLTRRPVSIS
ncbi:unnamed protein product [Caenorhabditis sp. 36 PRJEB53466]|nr:unnamed protein product [Caenorhabditis sp. 36 PRJEB53466]